MKFSKIQKVSEIAEILNGEIIGNGDFSIEGINRIESANNKEMTFLADSKYEKYVESSCAACILTYKGFDTAKYPDKIFITVEEPRKAFNLIMQYLNELKASSKKGIHPTAVIGDNCKIAETSFIGAYCVIGDNCTIGEHTMLQPSVILYDDIIIGDNTVINSNVTIYQEVEIGNNCIIHSGAVVGADGFGFEEHKDGSYTKIPQLGNVLIKDDVEIGCNTTVDRALLGSTILEKGVKLDNLIMIGHNVFVDEHTAMASQVGISGSTKIGKRNRLGGQVGFAGHLTTADDVVLLAQSGVAKSIEQKGIYFGAPARDRMRAFKIEAVINNLPELQREVKAIKRTIEEKMS